MIVATPAVVNVAVSCGSGTREDHVAVDHVAPDCQSVVTGVVKVIPLLPQQSPLFPVIAERFQLPAPAPFISCMSTFEAVTVQAVSVTCVHFVKDSIERRLVTELPASVKTPVIVILSVILERSVFVAVPVLVKVANVLVQVIVCEVQFSWTSL